MNFLTEKSLVSRRMGVSLAIFPKIHEKYRVRSMLKISRYFVNQSFGRFADFCQFLVKICKFDNSLCLFPFFVFSPFFGSWLCASFGTHPKFPEQKPNKKRSKQNRTKTEQFPISSRLCLRYGHQYRRNL